MTVRRETDGDALAAMVAAMPRDEAEIARRSAIAEADAVLRDVYRGVRLGPRMAERVKTAMQSGATMTDKARALRDVAALKLPAPLRAPVRHAREAVEAQLVTQPTSPGGSEPGITGPRAISQEH